MSIIRNYILFFGLLSTVSYTGAHLNLFLNLQEVMRLLGISAELYYVRDGQINDYALNFIVPVPANVKEIAFSWQSLAGRPLPYTINIATSDPAVLPRPTLNISNVGEIPTEVQTFSISMKCTGIHPAEVEVTITMEITLNRAKNNITELVFRRKKICLGNDGIHDDNDDENNDSNDDTEEDHMGSEGDGKHHYHPHREDNSSIDNALLLETVIPPHSSLITFIVGGILAFILLATLISAAYCARGRSKRQNQGEQLMRTSSFQRLQTHPLSATPSIYISPSILPTYTTLSRPPPPPRPLPLPLNKDCYEPEELQRRIGELTVQRCRVRLSSLLQEGTYGRIYRGTYNENQEVLVKTVAQHSNQNHISSFLQEGMSLYGASHSGILSLLGVSIDDYTTPFLLYPAPNNMRNLKLFLLDAASLRPITSIQIVMMSSQLTLGLVHLHSHGVIHKDIAARNCVIDDQFQVKLTDSSLSCDLFPRDYNDCLGDGEYHPIKWLALELFQKKQCTEASDVWAFGILMWELCTFAKQPYAEVDPFEMERYLRDGFRLAQPYNCPDELFKIMAYCWATCSTERPTFAQLQVCLSDFYTQLTRYV